jgi:hypothetical protein
MEGASIGLIEKATLQNDDLYPRPLAENLPLVAAKESLNRFMTRQTKTGLFHSAWRHVEYALNREVGLDDSLKESYFDDASQLLGKVIRHKTTEDLQLASLTLGSYLPCFLKRARGDTITSDDCTRVYQSLGSAITYLEPRRPDDPPCWRMTETAVLALAARTKQPELLLYPTSPREEASDTSSENHDSYFMAADKKLPLQQKLLPTAKSYETHITLLNLLPMLSYAYTKANLPMPDEPIDNLNYLLGLIVAETHAAKLTKQEKQFLDHLSRAVAWHYQQAVTNNTEAAA